MNIMKKIVRTAIKFIDNKASIKLTIELKKTIDFTEIVYVVSVKISNKEITGFIAPCIVPRMIQIISIRGNI